VGNRIGAHSHDGHHPPDAEATNLTPEDVDASPARPWATPRARRFRTADMVGLDTFVHVADNCYALPDDEERDVFQVPAFIRAMVEKKILGDKTKGGFYKKQRGRRDARPATATYRAKGKGPGHRRRPPRACARSKIPRERVKKLVADRGPRGRVRVEGARARRSRTRRAASARSPTTWPPSMTP
jgi:3-hydroxyacyl-CoA dehydrogenase